MPMLTPPPLPVDVESWKRLSRPERIRPLAQDWVENGAGTPAPIYVLYIVKIIAFVVGGLFILAATPGIGGVTEIADWWHEPIVYQKLVILIWLFEMMGLGGSFGPLTFKFLPPSGRSAALVPARHHPAATLAARGAAHQG